MTNNEMRNIRLTIWILFNPDVHKIINSLTYSSFEIVSIADIKKEKGISFVNILGKIRSE